MTGKTMYNKEKKLTVNNIFLHGLKTWILTLSLCMLKKKSFYQTQTNLEFLRIYQIAKASPWERIENKATLTTMAKQQSNNKTTTTR